MRSLVVLSVRQLCRSVVSDCCSFVDVQTSWFALLAAEDRTSYFPPLLSNYKLLLLSILSAGFGPDSAEGYVSPSASPSESELQRLSRFSSVVPDTADPASLRKFGGGAAYVSTGAPLLPPPGA